MQCIKGHVVDPFFPFSRNTPYFNPILEKRVSQKRKVKKGKEKKKKRKKWTGKP